MVTSIVQVVKDFPIRSFDKGTVLFTPDLPSDMCYAIQNGFVKVFSLDADGNEQLLWIAGRYDVVPSEALFRKHHDLRYFYAALTDVTVYEFSKQTLLELADLHPEVTKEIAQGMSEHYDDLLLRVQSVDQQLLRDKLIYTLLFICQRFATEETLDLYKLGLTMTHQDIANMVGASRESTSIELGHLKREGVIAYTRHSFRIHYHKLQMLIAA